MRRFREKLFGGRGIVAQPAAELLEQVGHLFFGRGQVLQRQLVFAAQLTGAVVSLGLRGQFLLRPVQRLKLVEILHQFLHRSQVVEGLDDLLLRLVMHSAQAGNLRIRFLFVILQQVRRETAAAVRRGAALRDVAGNGVVGAGALPDVFRLLPQQSLQILFHVVQRMFTDEMFHAFSLLVEFLVQLVLSGQQSVQLWCQGNTLFGIGLGQLPGQFLRGVAELLLFFNQLLQIVIECRVFGRGILDVGLFAQEVVVILDTDDL